MTQVIFEKHAKEDGKIGEIVQAFLDEVPTLEVKSEQPITVFQDGVSGSYYIKCSVTAKDAAKFSDLNAKLDFGNAESYRANRQLLLNNVTFRKMKEDASKGREFNDIIVEYNKEYETSKPLKVWGGQHRLRAISEATESADRWHGFKVYFELSKQQRTEVALISNTNIAVSNDTFDRMVEETTFGNALRKFCQAVGLLDLEEDFPDSAGRTEKITIKKARSFVVNFYLGKEKAAELGSQGQKIDDHVYEPYLAQSGAIVDELYKKIVEQNDILSDRALIDAGKRFVELHKAQYAAAKHSSTLNRKSYRNKALIESVLCGWSYVSGLLQGSDSRLRNHYRVPRTSRKILDPLNSKEMSDYKHDYDPRTYRGLGARSDAKDRQRMAQLFLAKSNESNAILDKKLINEAVSRVVGLLSMKKSYVPRHD